MSTLASIWTLWEPILFLVQIVFGLRFKYHTKVSEKQLEVLCNDAFKEIEVHLRHFKAIDSIKSPKEMYIRHLKGEVKQSGNQYVFLEGELQLRLLEKFHLPKNNSVNKFLIQSFFFIHGYPKTFKYLLFRDRIAKFFGRKHTILHYLSISNWRGLSAQELSEKVVAITKVSKDHWNDKYLIPKNKDIAESNPNISRAIDKVLLNGVISEKSIFNLSSTEKLIFIHKYSEGWDVFNRLDTDKEAAKAEVKKWEKSGANNAHRKLNAAREKVAEIDRLWLPAPIGSVLEELGFQKLFNKMDGVYVLPLSMVPNKFHKNIEAYIQEVIIENAQLYVNEALDNKNPYITIENKILKYLIITHIIPMSEISIVSQNRSFEVSSPKLSRMLFTSFLSKEDSGISSLYINDIVRNVDFISLLGKSKTDDLIRNKFEEIKVLLWRRFEIDLLKPYKLSSLTENEQEELINLIIELDDDFVRCHLLKRIKNIIKFYFDLNNELSNLKK